MLRDGESVEASDVLAKVPRETATTPTSLPPSPHEAEGPIELVVAGAMSSVTLLQSILRSGEARPRSSHGRASALLADVASFCRRDVTRDVFVEQQAAGA